MKFVSTLVVGGLLAFASPSFAVGPNSATARASRGTTASRTGGLIRRASTTSARPGSRVGQIHTPFGPVGLARLGRGLGQLHGISPQAGTVLRIGVEYTADNTNHFITAARSEPGFTTPEGHAAAEALTAAGRDLLEATDSHDAQRIEVAQGALAQKTFSFRVAVWGSHQVPVGGMSHAIRLVPNGPGDLPQRFALHAPGAAQP